MGRVTDIDRGYAALVKRIYGFAKPRIEVGILSGQGAEDAKQGSDELTLIEVAVFNEFGTTDAKGHVHVPERSFIRAWFDENEARLREELAVLMRGVVTGERSKEQILQLMAVRCVGQIQQRIADHIDPDNAPSTIARKGSSTPLIDKGQLRAGVSSRIRER